MYREASDHLIFKMKFLPHLIIMNVIYKKDSIYHCKYCLAPLVMWTCLESRKPLPLLQPHHSEGVNDRPSP